MVAVVVGVEVTLSREDSIPTSVFLNYTAANNIGERYG